MQMNSKRMMIWCLALAASAVFARQMQSQSPAATVPAVQAPNTSATDAGASSGGQTPILSSNVDEVSVDLVVHDKKHKLVSDLKPGDVVVTEDGKPVKITGFRLVSGDAATGHLVLLVFDRMDGASAKTAEQIAEKLLATLSHKGFSFAVLDVSGRLRLLQGFSENRNQIVEAVKAATLLQDKNRNEVAAAAEKDLISIAHTGMDSTGRHANGAERSQAQTLLAALEDSQKIVQDQQHARPSLAGILALSEALLRASERKSILYFASGPPLDTAAKEMVHTIAGAASKSGVSLYTIDMNAYGGGSRYQEDNAMMNAQSPFNPTAIAVGGGDGHVQTVTPMQQESAAPISGTPSAQGPSWGANQDIAVMTDFARQRTDNPFAPKSPLVDLATGTGGVYIDPGDSLKKILAQVHQDLTTYYELTYAAPVQDYDGKYRAISVRSLRPGVTIRHKEGYFAVPAGDEGVVQPFEAPLIKILAQPQLPADFKFNAAALRLGLLPDGNENSLVLETPFSALDMHQDTHNNLYTVRLSMVAQIKDKSGAVVEHFSEDAVRHGALEELEKDKSKTITMQRHFFAAPGDYVLEAALMDRNSGQSAAQRIPFTIPAAQPGPALSDMVLVRKMDKLNDSSDPLEPLQYDEAKVTPNLSGQLSAEDKSVSVFFLVHPDSKDASPAKLELSVGRNGHEGKRVPMPLNAGSNATAVPYLASLKTASLPPGNYEVKALLTQGTKTTEQALSFRIGGAQPAEEISGAAQGHGGAMAADVNFSAPGEDVLPAGALAITVPANPVPPPTPEEVQSLIADARHRALSFTESLPNFICTQITERAKDSSGTGRWEHIDRITETLTYRDKQEERKIVAVDDKPSNGIREGMKIGVFSTGELGGNLRAVFADSAKAAFEWKETDMLGGDAVQVFNYHVDRANSMFDITASNNQSIKVGYHGQVYLDSATRNVRRISITADDLPADFPTHATSMSVDYDYVAIGGHDFLLPVSAAVSVRQKRTETVLNTMEFHNYRKFASEIRLLPPAPEKKP